MSCTHTRQQLVHVSVADFDGIHHLSTCDDCAALAERIRGEERALYQTLDRWVDRPEEALEPIRSAPARWAPMLQVAAVVLASVGALWLALPSDTERPPPETAGQQPPVMPPPQTVAGTEDGAPALKLDTLPVGVGSSLVLDFPAPIATVSVDPALLRYELHGHRRLQLSGVSQGVGQVRINYTTDKAPTVYGIEVGPAMAPEDASQLPSDERVSLGVGDSMLLDVGGVPAALAMADPTVADVLRTEPEGDSVVITGLRPGVVTLAVSLSLDARPQIYTVVITAP